MASEVGEFEATQHRHCALNCEMDPYAALNSTGSLRLSWRM
jgi:hypothetical protein